MNAPDPRSFGRMSRRQHQLEHSRQLARTTALGSFVAFAVCLGSCWGVDSDGLRVLLGVLAFNCLLLGMAAASEA